MEIPIWKVAGLMLLLQIYYIGGSPSGAPRSACSEMRPGHYGTAPTDVAPYDIKRSAYTYCPRNEVNITLVGAPYNTTFKGFLCQARTAVGSDETFGTLTSVRDSTIATTNNCPGKASVTHADRTLKKAVHLTWTPDASKTVTVYIVCTIVQQYSTFWVKESTYIEYAGVNKCTADGEVKGLPATCLDSEDCDMAFGMSICDTNRQCICPSHMTIAHPTHTYCSDKVLGDSCTSNTDCGRVAEALCDRNVCTCKPAFTSNTTTECYLKVLGDSCSSNDNCRGIPKSVCNGTCKCPPEYKHQNNRTHTNCVLRELGDDCMSNAQCAGTANAKCITGRCKIEVVDVCTSDTDCTETDRNKCVEGKCTREQAECMSDAQCTGTPNTKCIDGKCKVDVQDECTSDTQCTGTPNTKCIDGQCKVEVDLDECTSDTQCAGTANTKCIAGKCQVDDADDCMTDTDCTGTYGNQCIDGRCTSGAMKTGVLSLSLMFGIIVFLRHILSY